MSSDRVEFRYAAEDTSSIIGPSIGIGILAAMGASMVYTVLSMIVGIAVDLPVDPLIAVIMVASVVTGWLAAVRFVRWRRRVIRERMLVVDARGITYVAYADKSDLTPWEEIAEAREEKRLGDGEDSYTLVIRRRTGRDLRLPADEFQDYGGIKAEVARRLGRPIANG